jgi:peptide/nickel transport system permease protein
VSKLSIEEYSLRGILRELLSYKSAIAGIAILVFLVGLSLFAVLATPFSQAGEMWNDKKRWVKYPRNALPEWYNYFSAKKLPPNIVLKGNVAERSMEDGFIKLIYRDKFSYNYDDFPSEIIIFTNTTYFSESPTLRAYLIKPSGERLSLGSYSPRNGTDSIYVTNNIILEDNLTNYVIEKIGEKPSYVITIPIALFMKYSKNLEVMKGDYIFEIEVLLKNSSDSFEYQAIIYGRVFGLAGTDTDRRPLDLGILWGTPLALAFGIVASFSITFIQLIFAAISGYYGGKIDSIIQRLSEMYMILPFLPFLIMVSLLYGLNLWGLLLLVIVLSIFGTSVKTYRVWVMQLKSSPYVEAAMAYGASNMRIIFLYILPRLIPPMVPSLVLAIPSYVFLEAALALLGLSDPKAVSWGRIVEEAFDAGAVYKGYYHWVLIPSSMLILTAVSFALIGLALDRIVNPRLREA